MLRKNRIREYRKIRKIRQRDLAVICGCHYNTLSMLERDILRPSLDLARKVARTLRTSIDDLWPPLGPR